MGGKKKAAELERTAERMRERDVEDAIRAIALRRTGTGWGVIARQIGRTQVEVEELARAGYIELLGQQDPDLIRAEVEDRQDQIIRQANIDLASAETIAERNACYRTILAADAARVRMLGLTIKAGDDA
ncbi:hypothetical protein GCM10009775_02810 [Microbacterium aoyamense]|uniref:Uncharacterized protein n=1 Tax=Microbacterium aoyamense TaxID=344166 RepID=A0ABN2P7T2_9MICO|nr:hypothetical protein [Microbacterium aoyamense]